MGVNVELFATITGYIVMILVSLGIFSVLCSFLIDKLDHIITKIKYHYSVQARKDLAKQISLYHYWFNEPIYGDTSKILKLLGEHIDKSYDGVYTVEKFREELRILNKVELNNEKANWG